jgi:hypothetical protein
MYSKVLSRPTLVLNRNWQPVNIASVARALTLVGINRWGRSGKLSTLRLGRLKVARPQDDQPFVRTVSMASGFRNRLADYV